jgi:hypothetical protein
MYYGVPEYNFIWIVEEENGQFDFERSKASEDRLK